MVPLLGANADAVDVVNREVTGKLALDLTAAQEVTQTGNFKNVTSRASG